MSVARIRRSGLLFVGMALLVASFSGLVSAAGTAIYTAEGLASVQPGATYTLNVYVNASGAAIWSGSIDISLTNFTYQSYSPGSSPFGIAQVIAGNTPGSTSFTIGVAHTSGSGSTGKTLLGVVTLKATGAGGSTGQIQLSGAQADDFNVDPMAASSQNRSVSITAPPNEDETGNGGGSGNQPSNDSGDDGQQGDNSTLKNPAVTPNANSSVNVPNEQNEPEEISEEEYSELVNDMPDEEDTEEPETPAGATDSGSNLPLIGGIVLMVLLVAGSGLLALKKLGARRYSSVAATSSQAVTDSDVQAPIKKPQSPQSAPEPTVIRPEPSAGDGENDVVP